MSGEVKFEVWRSHASGGRDVLVQPQTSEAIARAVLDEARADKAKNYPDAPIDFYLSRVTLRRERVAP